MSNINQYLLWRGDIELDNKYIFNEIDSMILARFSYLRFDEIEMNSKENVEEVSNKMKYLNDDKFLYNGDKELITNLGKSERFKNMLITDYVEIEDKKIEKQFGAVTIHISDEELYISFIGTNSTINGWKEDFNMSFMSNVPCQIAGKEYLQMIAEKYPKKKIRVGGHSKGGNVAIYSAITASREVQNRIIKVYNYDGPGFSTEIIKDYGENEIIEKIETYLPQDSIIGRILNHKEKTTIVLSVEKGIYQHDIYSWQVLKDDIIKLEKNTQSSEDINETLKNWINNTTEEQRKAFIDTVFELFYSTEAKTFGEIGKTLSTSIPKILKKYNMISKEEKQNITQMIKLFGKIYFSVIKERENIKFSELKDYYIKESKKQLSKIGI